MEFLTVQEVAERLRVSTFTVKSLIRAGKIPVIRLGHRTIRIPESWLEELAKLKPEGKIEPNTREHKIETRPMA